MRPNAKFSDIRHSKEEDWKIIKPKFIEFSKELPDRILEHLEILRGDFGGFPVDRLTHCLQTATFAEKAGKDDQYVVMSLLHDIGDILGPYNHAEVASMIMKPFLSEENIWILQNHAIYQSYYFFHHIGLDRNGRDVLKDHPLYPKLVEFCEEFDCPAFDPKADYYDVKHFESRLRSVMGKPLSSIWMTKNEIQNFKVAK